MNWPGLEFEGMPKRLPAGESLVWQGSPGWRSFAMRVFHARKVAIYFGLLALWHLASTLVDSGSVTSAAISAAWTLVPGGLSVGVLVFLAWLFARTTRYTITNRRVVMQFGVALPITLNIPLRSIGTAALKMHTDGTGDIPMSIVENDRIAYLMLWPHARPWRLSSAEPMLRSVPDAAGVADRLAHVLASASTSVLPVDGSSKTDAAIDVNLQPTAAVA